MEEPVPEVLQAVEEEEVAVSALIQLIEKE